MNHLLAAATEARTLPKPEVLSGAPILRDWLAALDPGGVLCLVGTVSGHPRLDDGKRIYTSLLVALDPEGAWARTRSRWYRLDDEWPEEVMPDEVLIRGYTRLYREDIVPVVTALRTAILHHYGERFDG